MFEFLIHMLIHKNIETDRCYKKHELEKKKLYEERVLNVEHSMFTPLVFSVTGGMSRECTLFFKQLASLIAEKRDQIYSKTLGWLCCYTSFALLRSCIQCIRGARCTWECQLKHLFSHAIRENVRKILKVSSANPSWLLDKATFVKMGDIMSRNKGRILGLYDELSSFLTQVNIWTSHNIFV